MSGKLTVKFINGSLSMAKKKALNLILKDNLLKVPPPN